MVNPVNSAYSGAIQSYTKLPASHKLSDGTCLQAAMDGTQTAGQAARYDKLELLQEQCQVTLNVPDEMSIEVPRAWTMMTETFESWNKHLHSSLNEADRLNLPFGERLTFLREESRKWVEEKRQNDPEMFVQWLKINKYSIQQGESGLVGLPSDFTMEDYDSYVRNPFPLWHDDERL